MVTQCCMCKKILNRETNEWIQPTKHYEKVSHTYCPHCVEVSRKLLGLKPRKPSLVLDSSQ